MNKLTAKINGIRVRYHVVGPFQAPPVVLVHGFPFSLAMWAPQVMALKKNFRVLTYDLRGMGKSTLGPAPQPLEAYVDDLFLLMDHLALKRAALCGLSMGGYIALRAIERDPKRFWALALCDSKADIDGDEAKIGRAKGIMAIRAQGPKAFAKGMLPKLLAPETPRRRPALLRSLLKMMRGNEANGMANALAAMAGRSDTHSALRQYKGPTLVLSGSLDTLIPPALGQAMAREARHGKFIKIPGAGHLSNLEAPMAFNRALMSFLKKSSGLFP